MVMSDSHKQKIASGVKSYHACAKSKGCGKQKVSQPKPAKAPPKPKAKAKPKPKPKILAIEDIKKQTAPKKVKKNYSVDQAKRKQANQETKNLYKKSVHQILGIKSTASPEEVKKAYRGFLKFHPDKPTGDKEKFQMYATAYRGMINSINIK
jgi:hypothetical protein